MYNHVHQQDNTMPLIMQVTITIWRDICFLSMMVVMFNGYVGGGQIILVLSFFFIPFLHVCTIYLNCITSFRNLQ